MTRAYLLVILVRTWGLEEQARRQDLNGGHKPLRLEGGAGGPHPDLKPILDGIGISRAEGLTLHVRAWGRDANARALGTPTTGYADGDETGAHWVSPYIVVPDEIAQQSRGQRLGASADAFRPDDPLTGIELLAFTMKLLGLPVGAGPDWVNETMEVAREAGLLNQVARAQYLARPTAALTLAEALLLMDQPPGPPGGQVGLHRLHRPRAPGVNGSPSTHDRFRTRPPASA